MYGRNWNGRRLYGRVYQNEEEWLKWTNRVEGSLNENEMNNIKGMKLYSYRDAWNRCGKEFMFMAG